MLKELSGLVDSAQDLQDKLIVAFVRGINDSASNAPQRIITVADDADTEGNFQIELTQQGLRKRYIHREEPFDPSKMPYNTISRADFLNKLEQVAREYLIR